MSEEKKEPPKIMGANNFWWCSECKNASNVPEGIPHAATCSLPDLMRQKAGQA